MYMNHNIYSKLFDVSIIDSIEHWEFLDYQICNDLVWKYAAGYGWEILCLCRKWDFWSWGLHNLWNVEHISLMVDESCVLFFQTLYDIIKLECYSQLQTRMNGLLPWIVCLATYINRKLYAHISLRHNGSWRNLCKFHCCYARGAVCLTRHHQHGMGKMATNML